jgi:hypothetical protein
MRTLKISDLERILLIASLLLLLIGNFLLSGDLTTYFNFASLASLMVLGVYYGFQLRSKEGILCVVLSSGMLYHFFASGSEWQSNLFLYYAGILTIFGLLFLKKSMDESRKNRDFELFATLISLSFFYPLLHIFYFSDEKGFIMVYHFATVFLVAYVMYYENLWDKYNVGEKKILTLLLVLNLFEVALLSFRNIY